MMSLAGWWIKRLAAVIVQTLSLVLISSKTCLRKVNEKMRKFYTPYQNPPSAVNTEVGERDRAKQSFKTECDVNNILRKMQRGVPPMFGKDPSKFKFGDFSEVGSYQEAHNLILEAHEQFMMLPAKTRERFGNNPGAFLEFVNDPANTAEMIKLGLASKVEKEKEPAPQKVIVVETKTKKKPPAGNPDGGQQA